MFPENFLSLKHLLTPKNKFSTISLLKSELIRYPDAVVENTELDNIDEHFKD